MDVLSLDVELEAGLGIDSIKRVEIFSAIQQQLPGLPEVTPSTMGQLKTLRDILAFLSDSDAPASKPECAVPELDIEQTLLQIVAEKTGYPMDVLTLDVELEAGLGIDSIKRVEIFSAVQQRIPAMPELKPEDAGRLRTLRDILLFAGTVAGAVAETPIHRHELEWVQSEGCGLPMPGLLACNRIALLGSDEALAGALADRLGKLNISTESAGAVPDGCRAVVYLGGLSAFENVEKALRANHDAFEAARELARGPEPPALFVTVQDTNGDCGAWAAGIGGIAKTFAREWPQCAVKTIELDRGQRSPDEITDAILTELLAGGSQIEVAIHADGSRLVPMLRPVEIGERVDRIGPDSVIVASGGGRGVTAACLMELAGSARPQIALLGRTPLEDEPADCREAKDEAGLKHALSRRPGQHRDLKQISREVARILAAREIRATLRSLDQAGSPCAYFTADMRDRASIERAVASARERFGPITAIVHGAGVISDKKIAEKTSDRFSLVFETKAAGLRDLLADTKGDPIDTICLFSSVAGRFGNPGQCDYAAANEVLNRVAAAEARRRGPKCLVRSIAWGPWDGGMVTASLAAHFRSRGASLIPLASGARAFVRELGHSAGGAEVVIAADGDSFPESRRQVGHSAEILVNSATWPFLDSHRVREEVVVPVVLVNEWFHRFAESCRPGMRVVNCRDLRVLRGIPVPAFASEGQLLRIVSSGEAAGEIHCELRSSDDTLHYSATLEVENCDTNHEASAKRPCVAETRTASEIYGPNGHLFHGRCFQVIEELSSLEDASATAVLRTTRQMRWPSGPWKTDAAALDGVLQLIRLWGVRHLGGPSLPTRIGSFVRRGAIASDPVLCEIRPRTVGALSLVADASILLPDGSVLAEIHDIEMHLTPGA